MRPVDKHLHGDHKVTNQKEKGTSMVIFILWQLLSSYHQHSLWIVPELQQVCNINDILTLNFAEKVWTKHKTGNSITFLFSYYVLQCIIKEEVVLPEHDINWQKPVLVKKPKIDGVPKR
jgi:hypothetical protein